MQISKPPLNGIGSPEQIDKSLGPAGLRRPDLAGNDPNTAILGDVPPSPKLALPALTQAGLSNFSPQLNQRVSRGQQALAYLEKLQTQLASLKFGLSATLSQSGSAGPSAEQLTQLNDRLTEFKGLWQQRQQASGGSIDGQLRFLPEGQGQQTFKIRGLDAATLGRNEKETLSFTTGSDQAHSRIVTAVLEANQPLQARIFKLDQTLGTAAIRVSLDANGEPTLSVPEANWPSTARGLEVRGGGIRFPASQFHKVKLDAEPSALLPESWQMDDPTKLRQTLQQVVRAQQLMQQAQGGAHQMLANVDQALDQSSSTADTVWAQDFANSFDRLSKQPTYVQWRTIAPALQGITRERVTRLLGLGEA